MGSTCSMHVGISKIIQHFGWKTLRKDTLARSRFRLKEDNVIVDS
jgi:hypothetical protein